MPPSLEPIIATFCVARSVSDGDVVLLLDVGAVLDQQAAHLLALRAGLVGLELHAEDLAGELRYVGFRARDLDAAALAAAAGVDLRLDDPDRAAELLRRLDRFLHAEGGIPRGTGTPKLARISLPWYS